MPVAEDAPARPGSDSEAAFGPPVVDGQIRMAAVKPVAAGKKRLNAAHGNQRNSSALEQTGNRYLFVKIDLGSLQCTPLRISTTWERRQSQPSKSK